MAFWIVATMLYLQIIDYGFNFGLIIASIWGALVCLIGYQIFIHPKVVFFAAFAAVLALVVPALTPLLDQERLLPIRSLARLAGREAKQGEPLLVVGYKRYSVVYYSGRPVLFVSSPSEALKLLSGREAGLGSHAGRGTSVLLLGSDPELLEFGVGPGDSALLARRDAHRLVRLPLNRLHQLVGP